MSGNSGYFGIGIHRGKAEPNHGTLWYILCASSACQCIVCTQSLLVITGALHSNWELHISSRSVPDTALKSPSRVLPTLPKQVSHSPNPPPLSGAPQAWTRLPFFKYADMDSFCSTAPYDAPWVAVESGGTDLADFVHPPRAVYILGSEDHGLPPDVLAACPLRVSLDSVRSCSYNVAVAGSILVSV